MRHWGGSIAAFFVCPVTVLFYVCIIYVQTYAYPVEAAWENAAHRIEACWNEEAF